MKTETTQPVSILIAALGGEGGGVLSNWLVESAMTAGFPVQSTSIPGVAQRTGATTYYLEIYPVPIEELEGLEPVLTLTPGPGEIDLMIASELLEAGRAMQNGFISPDRTALIASTHRFYAVAEKTVTGDGRYQAESIIRASEELAQKSLLRDYRLLAEQSGSIINAVLLGAIAASEKLPFGREMLEQTIQKCGIAVEENLKGFSAGFHAVLESPPPSIPSEPAAEPLRETQSTRRLATSLLEQVRQDFPEELQELTGKGVLRTIDFQDLRYGKLYLKRLATILNMEKKDSSKQGFPLTIKVASNLAMWMAYEDVVRVADLKTRSERISKIRDEVHARKDDLVEIVDYLKPGIEELCALLPHFIAKPLLNWASRNKRLERFHFGMHLRTTSITGFLLVRFLAMLRPWRRLSYRFTLEQSLIERWLDLVLRGAAQNHELALEIIECSKLLKGYGETHRRGLGNFQILLDHVIEPGLGTSRPGELVKAICSAREHVLANPEPVWLKEKMNDADETQTLQIQSS